METGKPEVSIIMANYNCAKWVKETIASVQRQTFQNWELIITDDASQDASVSIIREEQVKDPRIKLYILEQNQGAAKARNFSLEHAQGRFIAYLDSDDLWVASKLEKQLHFMKENGIAMCYTDYDLINECGEYRKTIRVPKTITYDAFLKGPISCSHTVAFDLERVEKEKLIMPDLRRGQDSATWLQVLKCGVTGYALSESLAKYRRHEGSLSSNKLTAIKRTWHLYRKVEKLPLLYACRCFVSYAVNAVKKYS